MAGIEVREVKSVEIVATDGQKIEPGDTIVICIKGQDIACRFVELDRNGYFVTKPFVAGEAPVKYRIGSIEKCYRLTSFVWRDDTKKDEEDEDGESNDGYVRAVG